MSVNIFDPRELLGPLKIFGASKPDTFGGYREGWFYPLYTTRAEAIQADIDRNGKGIYRVLTFYNRKGEFYVPESYANLGELRDPLIYTLYEGDGAENPFKRIQNRLSILIEEQLPEFIQTDYTMFITFLKAYYEFLEQNNQAQEILQDITRYSDIDKTSNELVSRFLQNYAYDLPQSEITNNRFLIKKIREIYSKKGTEPAYEILFNVLYKESINFFYPYDVVLKPSSGKWATRYVLRIRQTNYRQNIFDFENTEILGKTSKAKAIVNKVIKIDLQEYEVYELVLDPTSISGDFLRDEEIEATKTILLTNTNYSISPLSARVYSIISKIDIIDGGIGYTKGHPVTITDNTGILATAKVNRVNRYGSITSFDIVEPGVNYSPNTVISVGAPTENLVGTYSMYRGAVTVTFPIQHGLVKGKRIDVTYTGNIYSPIDNTNHTVSIVSVPNVRTIRYRYPGF
jgi:hypothetical protein